MAKDYYKILGITKGATDKEVKKAYRKLATEYHPDKTKGDPAKEERFKEISEAYQVLGNKEKRSQYDELGSDWEQFQQSGASYEEFVKMRDQRRQYQQYHQQAGGTGGGGFGGAGFGGSDFSDIFESFFRGGAGGDFARPGADLSGEVSIDLSEAYSGTERLLDLGGERINLKIKPGAYDGLQLRARGKGRKGSRGDAGDLYIDVRVRPHPVYERRGDNLYIDLEIDLFTALLGGKVEVVTLGGKVNMNLKAGTQNGKQLRLRGKGMPVYGKSGAFGDLFVNLSVKLPPKPDSRQKEIIEELRKTYQQ